MAAPTDTFSESWHRVAGRRVALRSGVRAHRQFFRGERWHVLYEPFTNQFFRVRAGAWDFLARLREDKSVEQCWKEALAQHPAEAPGQEEVVQLLGRLHQANLLRSDLPPDAARLFERHQKRRQREVRSRLLSLLFIRIPLCDPDAFLVRTLPLVRWLISWAGAALWLVVVGFATKTGVDHWERLWRQGASVLAPGNLPWLYLAMVGLKLLHELGHGYTCRRFGGPVHTLGVMILVFSPLPFVDATSAWSFRERWKRVAVGAAGMVVEIFVGALAVFVWAATGPGVVNAIAYNLIFIASVSTLLANINPLLRFDGYYILCDLVDLPNLNQRARKIWRHWTERYLFGWRQSTSPAESRREAWWFGVYGAASFVYRVILFAGILLFVAGQWLLLGALMAVAGVITWVVVPAGRLIHYLAADPRIERVRRRAVASTVGLAAAVIGLLAVVPAPDTFSAPGVVRAERYAVVHTGSEGEFVELTAPAGATVRAGDVLARLRNAELDLEIEAARAEEAEALALEHSALDQPGEGLAAIRERLVAVRQRAAELARLRADLEIRAPLDGVWVVPELGEFRGRWISRGMAIGELVDPRAFRFSAVVRQEDADTLFGRDLRAAGVRLRGQAGERIAVRHVTIIPVQQEVLPSATLGWQGGGAIATRQDDTSGTRAAEPFFEIRASLEPGADVDLRQGRAGKLRCTLPWRPLLSQWYRSLRQLVQRRLQV
jgi:putative peptide zinc metalloprotease protein